MRIAIIAENICDTDTVKYIIHSLVGPIPVVKRPTRGPIVTKLKSRIDELTRLHTDLTAIILLEDLDNANCRSKVKTLLKEIGNSSNAPIIIQLAIQKIEAWYIALPEAVDASFRKIRPFPKPRSLTDNINDPKEHLKEIFRRRLGRDYRETTDGPQIASNFRYDEGTQYLNQSFTRFLRKIVSLS